MRRRRQKKEEKEWLGVVRKFLDARGNHEEAVRVIKAAASWDLMLGFTYVREDITAALRGTASRGLQVLLGLDRRWTLTGRTRDQLQRAQELAMAGVQVRLLKGDDLAAEYKQVGRSV